MLLVFQLIQKEMRVNISKIGPQIRMLYPGLSKTEQVLVDYLLGLSSDDVVGLKLSALSAEFSMSSPAVVKLAKRLGFAGFKELKVVLSEYAKLPTSEMFSEIMVDDDTETVVRKIINTSVHALEETAAILNIGDLERVVDYILSSNSRYFFGVGGSAMVAGDAFHKFLKIGLKCEYCSDANIMLMQAALMKPGDLLFAISHSGSSSSLITAAQLAKDNGATIVTITNYRYSKLAEMSNVTLCSTSLGSSPLTGENAAARIAQLNLIDVLFVLAAQRDEENAKINLEKTKTAVDKSYRD